MGEEREMLRREMDERNRERERGKKRVTEDKMAEEDLKEGK